jgi:hypothetical protein
VTYPDVVAAGGLAAALEQGARAAGIDLAGAVSPGAPDPDRTASVAADRGDVQVRLDDQERRFWIVISNDRHTWTAGGTPDLTDVVRLADLWRRGTGLRELTTRFPFLEHSRMAQAFEDGTDREVRWDLLLEDPDLARIRPFLEAARSRAELAAMYPFVSHGTRVLFLKEDMNKSAGVLEVVLTEDDRYRVSSTWQRSPQTADAADQAVSAALGALPTP